MEKKLIEKVENRPAMKFSAGALRATVWKNKSKTDNESEFSTITLERVYKDKEENWHTTNVFRLSDLPKAEILLKKVYESNILKEIEA